jgi:predicted RNase H-like nuclease
MPFVAGVDGAKAGWFAVWRDAGGRILSACVRAPAHLCEVLTLADVIAVDIPIGLTESGPRYCDQEARKALGAPRASSVFPAPIRSVLSANTRAGASLLQREIDGRGISAQGWGIVPKICEWDSHLRANRQIAKRMYEVHPEVCFWALNASRPMQYRKKSQEGRLERRELLARVFGSSALDEARLRHTRREVADDDLHDAFVALWTGERIHAGIAKRLPESPSPDSVGLPMTIWY